MRKRILYKVVDLTTGYESYVTAKGVEFLKMNRDDKVKVYEDEYIYDKEFGYKKLERQDNGQ